MKIKVFVIVMLTLVSIEVVTSQTYKKNKLKTKNDSIAYVIGANIGKNLKKNMDSDSLKFNAGILMQGFNDALDGLDSLIFKEKEKKAIMLNFQEEMQQKQIKQMAATAAPNKQAGQKFLDENRKLPGVFETASGLQYKIIKEGHGKTPVAIDQVTVNYEGKSLDGTIFDSSFDRKKAETFSVSNLIKGWTEGLQLMNEGGIYALYVKSDLAYGDRGNQSIPGGATLIFRVELIKTEPAVDNPLHNGE